MVETGKEAGAIGPLGPFTADLVLRILVPGALGIFLLTLTWPEAIGVLASVPIAGVLGFTVIGFLSYALYHALYISLVSRITSPQLRATEKMLAPLLGRKPRWVETRAFYIQWRESVAKGDPRIDYVARLASYVHAGYQAAILFAAFGVVAVARSLGLWWIVGLEGLALLLAAASAIQDRELMEIERHLIEASRESFVSYARQVLRLEPSPRH